MDPLVLRFIERITTVLTGAFSIYLGYRLFLSMPEQKTSDGKFVSIGAITHSARAVDISFRLELL